MKKYENYINKKNYGDFDHEIKIKDNYQEKKVKTRENKIKRKNQRH